MVFGIENQEDVNYLMPLRCMAYDVGEYERQAALIGKQMRRRKGITGAEFISGFAKDSRLWPCVTVVLYYGEKWDGAIELHDILDLSGIPKELRDIVNNYKIYLCEVRQFNDTNVFRTDLKQVFDCIRYSDTPEKLYELVTSDPAYREMEGDAYDLIAQYTKTDELMQVKRYKEGKVDMCKAITELIERGRREGIEQGIERGMEQGIEQGMERTIHIMKMLNIEKEIAIEQLVEAFGIGRDDAFRRVEMNW